MGLPATGRSRGRGARVVGTAGGERPAGEAPVLVAAAPGQQLLRHVEARGKAGRIFGPVCQLAGIVHEIEQQRRQPGEVHVRSEEHTSELQSLMRISYAVFCLKKKKRIITRNQCIRTNTSTYHYI